MRELVLEERLAYLSSAAPDYSLIGVPRDLTRWHAIKRIPGEQHALDALAVRVHFSTLQRLRWLASSGSSVASFDQSP
jgi:hypothetical protein